VGVCGGVCVVVCGGVTSFLVFYGTEISAVSRCWVYGKLLQRESVVAILDRNAKSRIVHATRLF